MVISVRGSLAHKMAEYSPPNADLNLGPQAVLVNAKWAKKAISRVARVLRGLLTNRERVDVLIQHGLLEQKDTEDVIKVLQTKIGERPNLFAVLFRQLENFSDGADVVKRLQGI